MGKAVCVDVRGRVLLLAPLAEEDQAPEYSQPALYRVFLPSGLLEIRGTLVRWALLEINGAYRNCLEFEAEPGEPRRINRRAHYRVSVFLKGEIAAFRPNEIPAELADCWAAEEADPARLERLDAWLAQRRHPCVVRDLSVGGARVSAPLPAPHPGDHVFLDLALAPGDTLRHLRAEVVDTRTGAHPQPLATEVRLRFERLGPRTESRLSRELNRLQLELLKKGIRI